jgi:hypothetical protein
MAQKASEYFSQLMKEAGKTDAEIAAALGFFSDSAVSAKFDDFVRRGTDDYSAMEGRAKAAQTRLDHLEKNWFPAADAEYKKALAERDIAVKALEDATRGILPINDPTNPQFDTSKFVTKEDLVKARQEQDNRYAQVIRQATRLASRHAAKYGEELDVDALEKLAVEKNLPLDIAYQQYVQPREEEAQKIRFAKEKQEFADEAVKKYAAQHKLPIDPVPAEQSPMYRKYNKEDLPKDIDADLLEAWHGGK